MKRPDYINPPELWKHLSREELLKILRELHEKHQEERREMAEAINKALASGIRCGPRRY